MSEQERLEATLQSLVAAYESGRVTRDVSETLKHLLPFSHYCCVAVCGRDDWLAATSNLLLPGSITTSLWPKSESLAGLAAVLSRQLRSFQQIADQRLFDVEEFHAQHGPGALIATPLPGAAGPPQRNAMGEYTSTAVGALIVDLDLEPATPVDLRMRAHLRTMAKMLAPLIEAPGRAAVEQLCAACFPAAALGGCLGAEVPPPKHPLKQRRRRGATCKGLEQWPNDDEADASGGLLIPGSNPFSDDAAAASDASWPGASGRRPSLDSQSGHYWPSRSSMDLSPISSSALPSRAVTPTGDAGTAATAPAAESVTDALPAQPLRQTLGEGSSAAEDLMSIGASGSLTLEDTARVSNGLLGRASPRLSSIEWPAGEGKGQFQKHFLGGAVVATDDAGTSTKEDHDDDVGASEMGERLASAMEQHPLWLSFPDKDLERNFASWHSMQLQKLDRAAISFASFIFAYLGFMPPHSLASHAPVAYSITGALMLFLLGFAWIANPWYLARRTLLLKAFVLLYTVFNSQVGFPGVLDARHGGDGPCTIPFVLRYINAQPLLTSCVVTMARLSIQAPIQAFQLAISLGLPRKVCGVCYAGRSPAACLVNLHTQQLLVGFIAPLAIVYVAERRFRANFLRSQAKKLS